MPTDDVFRRLARGWVWKARMKNGCVFTLWSPESMRVRGRAVARRELLRLANGPYEAGDDEAAYESPDIVSLWEARS